MRFFAVKYQYHKTKTEIRKLILAIRLHLLLSPQLSESDFFPTSKAQLTLLFLFLQEN